MRNFVRISLLLLLTAALARVAAAQTTGSIQGTVADQQGAIVAGATVELVQTATNVSKTMPTNAAGRFVFDFVQPGAYRLKVSAAGLQERHGGQRRSPVQQGGHCSTSA